MSMIDKHEVALGWNWYVFDSEKQKYNSEQLD